MHEHEKAKVWRQAHNLSVQQLADLSGYAKETIYWMERGQTPPNKKSSKPGSIPWFIWLRYKRICEGVERELSTGKKFDWGD